MPLSLLDGSVEKLREAIPNLSIGELETLRAAEIIGKTRKGAIAAIDEALAAAEPVDDDEPQEVDALEADLATDPNCVRNIIPGTTLHLGDGRKLAFEEMAVVESELAALLRESGQAA